MIASRAVALALCIALLGVGCSARGKWQSSGVPSPRDAGRLLETQGPSAMLRDSRPEGAPAVPVRRKLRPCCAFGSGLGVDVASLRVPGVRIDNMLAPDEIGPHRYDSGVVILETDRGDGFTPSENNGLLYTCRGGFIDTAHVRDYVDWTMYLSAEIGRNLSRGAVIELPDEGGGRRFVLRALPEVFVREHGLRELFSAFSQWAAFQLSLWHEIATWYGWSSIDVFPETASAFSPEDLYSNLVGIKLIDGIISDKTGRSEQLYNNSVGVWLAEVLGHLGTVSKETSELAIAAVDGRWWDSRVRLPSPDLVIRRNLDVSSPLLPWQLPERSVSPELRAALATECSDGRLPQALPLPEGLASLRFEDWLTLEVEVGPELRAHPHFASRAAVITQRDFPGLLEAIRQEVLERYGPQADRPERPMIGTTTGGDSMAQRKKRAKRDIENDYSPKRFAAKLRRLADCIESDRRFRIQIAGERVSIPPNATISIEHERGGDEEEVEFQLKWSLED